MGVCLRLLPPWHPLPPDPATLGPPRCPGSHWERRLPLEPTLLLYERNGLLNRLNQLQVRYADLAAQATSPNSFTEVLQRPDAYPVDEGELPPAIPVAIGLAATLALAVGAPVLRDRLDRSVSTSKQAATVFAAPVLSRIPALPARNGAPTCARAWRSTWRRPCGAAPSGSPSPTGDRST